MKTVYCVFAKWNGLETFLLYRIFSTYELASQFIEKFAVDPYHKLSQCECFIDSVDVYDEVK